MPPRRSMAKGRIKREIAEVKKDKQVRGRVLCV